MHNILSLIMVSSSLLAAQAAPLPVLIIDGQNPKFGGNGHHEAQLLAITHGEGRVFHTMLGHGPEAMRCVGFIVTLQRGSEWAATGKVTLKIPADSPRLRP